MADPTPTSPGPESTALALKKKGAATAKKAAVASKHKRNASNVQKARPPTFVSKLWSMINDSQNNEYIHWMPDGQSFQVTGREQFEAKILPKYFKHKNFSSFVRQLNMYGWHKVQDISSGTMNNTEEKWQFQSPNFVRGREDLLDNIQRNKGSKESDDEEEVDLNRVLEELSQIRRNQISIGEDLGRIRDDNQLLWNEHITSQEKYHKQAETLDRIVRFLASLYGNQAKLLQDITNPNASNSLKNQLLLMPKEQTDPTGNLLDTNGISPLDTYDSNDGLFPELPRSNRITSLSSSGNTPKDRNSPSIEEVTDRDNPNSTNNLALSLASRRTPLKLDNNGATTPRALFPELGPFDDTTGKSLSPIGKSSSLGDKLLDDSNTIDNLTKSIESQEMSLQQVQDWIQRMAPGYDTSLDSITNHSNAKDTHIITSGSPGDNIFDVTEFLVDPSPSGDIAPSDFVNDIKEDQSEDPNISPPNPKKRKINSK